MSNKRVKKIPEEFERICEDLKAQRNEYIWSRVLIDLEEFLASCKKHYESIESATVDLAGIQLEDSADKTNDAPKKDQNLKFAIESLSKNVELIQSFDLTCDSSALRLDPSNCSTVNSLTIATYEFHSLSKEISERFELQTISKKLKDNKVSAFKGCSSKIMDVSEDDLDMVNRVIFQYKKLILAKHTDDGRSVGQ